MSEIRGNLAPVLTTLPLAPQEAPSRVASDGTDEVWEKAKEFEAVFLAQMLEHAGLGETPSSFGGGYGEDAFSSFLTREYAKAMVEDHSLGIAEQVFNALTQGDA